MHQEHPFEWDRDAKGKVCRVCARSRTDPRHRRWPQTWTLNHDPGAVRQARVARRLTQQQLAAELGISKGYLSEIENGRRSANPALLLRIAFALRCPVERLERKAGVAA